MSSQASFSGRSSPARRTSGPSGGASGAASSGILASLRARTAGLRDGLEAAGESPASSLGGSYVLTGGGITGTARTLLDAFSGSGPGGQHGAAAEERAEEEVVDFGQGAGGILGGLEGLMIGEAGGGGSGEDLGLYHFADAIHCPLPGLADRCMYFWPSRIERIET